MTTTTYSVTGMTCDHCVAAVTQELMALESVTVVNVELSNGAVEVTSEHPLDPEAVAAAIDEAGYALA